MPTHRPELPPLPIISIVRTAYKKLACNSAHGAEWNSDELKASISQAHQELDEMLRSLAQAFDEALARYKRMDDVFPEGGG